MKAPLRILLSLSMAASIFVAVGCADQAPVDGGPSVTSGDDVLLLPDGNSPSDDDGILRPDGDHDGSGTHDDGATVGTVGSGGGDVVTAGPDGCVDGGDEICDDGFDNNCNGLVDEGCTCTVAEKSCYTGNPGELDYPLSACRAGTQACRSEFYSECAGEILPSPEVCDGIDNDCNGEIDELDDCVNTPPEAICPDDQNGSPLAFYTFPGDYRDADGDPMVSARWTIIERPVGSTADPDPAAGVTTEIFADIQGDYVLELEVTDDRGGVGRCTTRLETESDDDLRIEMVWNVGASNDASDVDLHLLRSPTGQWFDTGPTGDDCFFDNCRVCDASYDTDYEAACRNEIDHFNGDPNLTAPSQVEWTAPLDADDPRLDLDDVEGNGPENININAPVAGTYRLGVHYWDSDGYGNSTVTVRIYCGGSLAREFEPVTLLDRGASGDADTEFWEVADIQFSDGSCQVHELGHPGCRNICTALEAENGGCGGRQRGVSCN